MGERPAGIVVGMFLRVVGSPELAIEQCVGHAGVGLIHADDETAGGKVFLRGLVSAFGGWNRGGRGLRQLLHFDVLALHHFEQLNLTVGVGWIGGNHVGSGAFERGLFYGAFALEVVILKEVVGMLREVGNSRQQRGLLVVIVVAL